MGTLYSTDTIASTESLQAFSYMYISTATIWTYDYLCLLDKEWMFLLHGPWTRVKGLYIVTRYVPFFIFINHFYGSSVTNASPDECRVFHIICEAFTLTSVAGSESFFILRTYALWHMNRIVLAIILVSAFAVIVISVVVLFPAASTTTYQTTAVPTITGCYQTPGTFEFVILFVFELGLIILTLIRAMLSWRSDNNPLHTALLKHNIYYYACGLFFSLLNVLTSLFLHYAYSALFQNFQFIILAILATRMHLHLWHEDQQRRDPASSILLDFPLVDVSFALPDTMI